MRATILFGFLGAGKTTLLSHWLAESPPPDALIVNEFGALGFDGPRLARARLEAIELNGGCICCEQAGPLRDTIDRLADDGMRTVWIEASGLARPGEALDALDGRCAVDAAVTVVDATRFAVLNRGLGPFYADQIRGAGAVALNKIDLAAPGELEAAREGVAALNPRATLVLAERGRAARALVARPPAPRGAAPPTHDHVGAQSCVLAAPARLSAAGAARFFAGLPGTVWRAKGRMTIDGAAADVNYASGRLEIAPTAGAAPRRVAFIGRPLDPGALARALAGGQASAAAANASSVSKRAS